MLSLRVIFKCVYIYSYISRSRYINIHVYKVDESIIFMIVVEKEQVKKIGLYRIIKTLRVVYAY